MKERFAMSKVFSPYREDTDEAKWFRRNVSSDARSLRASGFRDWSGRGSFYVSYDMASDALCSKLLVWLGRNSDKKGSDRYTFLEHAYQYGSKSREDEWD